MRSPRDQAAFESCYVDVRDRLLLQTFALTGDLPAAQAAVRDALVIAWHHWPKVSSLEDPESWIRPVAWSRAQRRHTTRLFHRDKQADPDVQATLEALGALSPAERKVLLLASLTTLPPDRLAREIGLTATAAERAVDSAMKTFTARRGVGETQVSALLDALAVPCASVRWPRPTIITRAGQARRRAHTVLGAAAAVAALLVSGAVVTDAAGVRPDLRHKPLVHSADGRPTSLPTSAPEPDLLPETVMLGPTQVSAALPGTWTEISTSFNAGGDGLSLPCQTSRYADGQGRAVLLRSFGLDRGTGAQITGGTPRDSAPTAAQLTEVSASAAAARTAYQTELHWFTSCTDPRMQLMATLRVSGVGDQAALVVLRDWSAPERSLVVGVARSGALTTATVGALPGRRQPDVTKAAVLLGRAVTAMCAVDGAGACTTTPRATPTPPPAVSAVPSMIGEIDLPPVSTVTSPWVGTPPGKVVVNAAATRCDEASFSGAGTTHASTRTFVIPASTRLPPQFGLTETLGAMGVPAAKGFVKDVRDRLASCADRQAGTTVKQVRNLATRTQDLTVWRVEVQITDKTSVRYLMALVRSGGAVAQLGFVPSGNVEMAPGSFATLAQRALDRLASAPPA